MRKVLLVFAVFVTFVATQSDPDLPESFKDWKKRFNKKYPINGKTQAQAEAIYAKNAARIVKFNKKSNESYTIGMNVNGDMTDNELKSVVQGNSINNYDEAVKVMELKKKEGLLATTARPMNDVDLKASWPKSLDYSSWMQPVKDSGLCLAAGIAIAVVDVIDYWSKKNGSSFQYSEQNLIDCVANNSGCLGGSMYQIFMFTVLNGVNRYNVYKPSLDGSCNNVLYKPTYFLQNSCIFLPGGNETTLMRLLVRYGPLAIFMNLDTSTFRLYRSGVFTDLLCSSDPSAQDTPMVLVGYNTTAKGVDYWIVRTAMGSSFGLKGYAWIARNKGNMCGIANVVECPCVY